MKRSRCYLEASISNHTVKNNSVLIIVKICDPLKVEADDAKFSLLKQAN